MTDPNPTNDPTIDPIDLGSGAPWFAGVGISDKAREYADAAGDDFDTRLSLYWLFVGTHFLEQFPDGTAQMHQLYAQGAALNQPRRPRRIVQVTIASQELAQRYEDDLEGMERALASLLTTIAGRIGRDDFLPGRQVFTAPGGTVMGMVVGTVEVNL